MIRHVLANGKEVKSIEGMVVPANGATASVYQIAAEFAKNQIQAVHKKRGGKGRCNSNSIVKYFFA